MQAASPMDIQPICSVAWEREQEVEDVAFFKSLPPGYRFQPTDVELIDHYLAVKVMNKPLPRNKIHDVNLYDYNPETLSHMFRESGEKNWYFFTPRNRKYKNGIRPNRSVGEGYWKATGADKEIKNKQGKIIGFRKALVFYLGKAPKGDKTSWIMHEYRVSNSPECDRSVHTMRLDDWVLCRIYKKVNKPEKTTNKTVGSESKGNECETHEGEALSTTDEDSNIYKYCNNDDFGNSLVGFPFPQLPSPLSDDWESVYKKENVITHNSHLENWQHIEQDFHEQEFQFQGLSV